MNLSFSGPKDVHVPLFWLVTGVVDTIDLNRMSTGDRRDFPPGVSGSHMAGDRETPFREVEFGKQTPPNTYLLQFDADLTVGDYRTNKDPKFEEEMYGGTWNYSQEVFVKNSGIFAGLGINAILRYSAASKAVGIDADVYGILPSAREKLELKCITPIGPDSPPIPIRLFNETDGRLTSDFYQRVEPCV